MCRVLAAGAVLLLAARAAPAADATRAAPRLSAAPQATEYWELIARFDGGYRLFVRLGITNEGPGQRTAGAMWYLVHPDGRVSDFRNGRTQNWWKLSPDHLRFDIASSSLDLHAPAHRVVLDTHTQGAKIDLHFPAAAPPPLPATPPTAKFHSEVMEIAAPIEGTIWVRGMHAPVAVRGTTSLTHGWTDDSVPDVVQQHIGFVGAAADLAVYLSDVTTPSGDDDRWLVLERGGTVVYQTAAPGVMIYQSASLTAGHKYPLPGRMRISDGRVTLDIRSERVVLRTDPMVVIPQPFRLLFSLKLDPQWIWIDASFHLTVAADGDHPPIEAEGRGILALNFVNPPPR